MLNLTFEYVDRVHCRGCDMLNLTFEYVDRVHCRGCDVLNLTFECVDRVHCRGCDVLNLTFEYVDRVHCRGCEVLNLTCDFKQICVTVEAVNCCTCVCGGFNHHLYHYFRILRYTWWYGCCNTGYSSNYTPTSSLSRQLGDRHKSWKTV